MPIDSHSSDKVSLALRRLICEKAFHEWSGKHPSGFQSLLKSAALGLGIEIEVSGKQTYIKKDGRVVGKYRGLMPDTTSRIGYRICKSKAETRKYLEAGGIPVPLGRDFGVDEPEVAKQWVAKHLHRYVLKPSGLQGGKGVCVNLDISGFDAAWRACQKQPERAKGSLTKLRFSKKRVASSYGRIIIEEFVEGVEVRCLVLAGKCVAAVARFPANVMGDGVSSVHSLVVSKNAQRAKNVYLRRKLIEVDEAATQHLQGQGISPSTVPEEGAIVWLAPVSNISSGGENIDVSSLLQEEVKQTAERAVACIPGVETAGVDLIVRNLWEKSSPVLLEVNTNPNIGMHHYPLYGDPVDVASEILKQYA